MNTVLVQLLISLKSISILKQRQLSDIASMIQPRDQGTISGWEMKLLSSPQRPEGL
jgi:hypothetical protein